MTGAEFIALLIILAGWGIYKACLNAKVDNYDMSNVSIGKMSMDTGKSQTEIRRKLVNGEYDKDEHWKI